MIRITCAQCKSVLTIDDAFAGGVCRCQHCGTLQQVPAHLKGSGNRAGATGQGILVDQGTPAPNAAAGKREKPPQKSSTGKFVAVAIGVIAVAVLIFWLVHR